jgi:hypothetical protein
MNLQLREILHSNHVFSESNLPKKIESHKTSYSSFQMERYAFQYLETKQNYILYLSFDFELTGAVFQWNTSARYSSNEIFFS